MVHSFLLIPFFQFNIVIIVVVFIILQVISQNMKYQSVWSAEAESHRAEICQYETFEVNCTQVMKSTHHNNNNHHHHQQHHRGQSEAPSNGDSKSEPETGTAHVILIEKSKYGRMQLGRCATKDYGHVGCHHDVMDHVLHTCSGLEACRIHVPDEWLKVLQPCPKDFASFLEITYKCLPVAVASKTSSCSGHINVDVNHQPIPEGYLSSHVTQTTNHGSKNCPWLIKASQGQRLTLTLIELVTSRTTQESALFPPYYMDGNKMADKNLVVVHPSNDPNEHCLKYAHIREPPTSIGSSSSQIEGGVTKICGSSSDAHRRNRVIYTSKGHKIEVTIFGQGHFDKNAPRFLLHYKAMGCPMLTTPVNGWLETEGKDVIVSGCNSTNERRVHKCNGNQWSNQEVLSCTDAGGISKSYSWSTNNEEWSSPLGILFVSAIGVSLGLVIGVSLLFVVVVCLKRYRTPVPPIGRNLAIAYDAANQMEDIYQHHHQLNQSQQTHHHHQFLPLNQGINYTSQDSNPLIRSSGQGSNAKITTPPKIEIIPLQAPMTYGALWPPGDNNPMDVHTRISEGTTSSHALSSSNHGSLFHCNCDLDVIATTDAVNRRHLEKGHLCWPANHNECSYDYPEVVSNNKKPLIQMPGFDLSNHSSRIQ